MAPLLPTVALLFACTPDDPADPPPPETGTTGSTDGNVHDPLSMPEAATLDPADFVSASVCETCHPSHAAEWRTSMHAYAMVDPVFQALVELRQLDLAGTEDQFCTQCHSAIGTRGGEIVAGFAFSELSPIVMEGITCESCHAVVALARDHNSGHVLDPSAPVQGPISDPIDGPIHASQGSALFATSEFCGACHDVIETDGLDLERPYREWRESPSAAEGQACQDCHMPSRDDLPAVVDGPLRTTHSHRWVGVDVPLVDGWMSPEDEEALRAGTRELLATAASLELDAPPEVGHGETFDVHVRVENRIPAHNLPTGSTFLRQVWVELVARDSAGTVLYETGRLDANGDLKDYWSELEPYGDPDLLSLSSGFVDDAAHPTLFSWTAAEHTSGALSPLYERTWTLFVPTGRAAAGPVTIESRLRFRALPPYLLRMLAMDDAVGKIEVHELAVDTIEVGQRAE